MERLEQERQATADPPPSPPRQAVQQLQQQSAAGAFGGGGGDGDGGDIVQAKGFGQDTFSPLEIFQAGGGPLRSGPPPAAAAAAGRGGGRALLDELKALKAEHTRYRAEAGEQLSRREREVGGLEREINGLLQRQKARPTAVASSRGGGGGGGGQFTADLAAELASVQQERGELTRLLASAAGRADGSSGGVAAVADERAVLLEQIAVHSRHLPPPTSSHRPPPLSSTSNPSCHHAAQDVLRRWAAMANLGALDRSGRESGQRCGRSSSSKSRSWCGYALLLWLFLLRPYWGGLDCRLCSSDHE